MKNHEHVAFPFPVDTKPKLKHIKCSYMTSRKSYNHVKDIQLGHFSVASCSM